MKLCNRRGTRPERTERLLRLYDSRLQSPCRMVWALTIFRGGGRVSVSDDAQL
nr:MAG TPA: hypothetical protein [Caudoviricetes sp.]